MNHKCCCQVTDAVIFDMDGVIVDSEMLYLNLRWQFAREKNPEVTLEELYPTVGRSSEGSWSLVAEAVHNGMTWQELLAEYRKTVVCTYASIDFASVFRREMPGVLESLKQRGIRLALASSNGLSIVEKILTDNGIRPYFEVVVSGESFRRSKPDPEIYFYTMEKMGVKPAHLAGMRVAAVVDDRFGFDRSLADYEVKQISDILQLVEGKTDEKTGGQDK